MNIIKNASETIFQRLARHTAKRDPPICPEFIASFIVAIAGKALERVFNKVISILAAHSFFPRKIKALLDASDLESTERIRAGVR